MKRSISFENAKNQYVHRFTLDHLPQWAKNPHYNESTGEFVGYYKPHYKSDLEWYENTSFPGENGISKKEQFCNSTNLTWPLGKGFSKEPCIKGQK